MHIYQAVYLVNVWSKDSGRGIHELLFSYHKQTMVMYKKKQNVLFQFLGVVLVYHQRRVNSSAHLIITYLLINLTNLAHTTTTE